MKKLVCLLLAIVLLFTGIVLAKDLKPEEIPPVSETDIEVTVLSSLGILKGTDKGFELERPVTRAEAVAFILRMLPEPPYAVGAKPVFPDLDGHWASKDVARGVLHGFIHGNADGTFSPERQVTAQEFAKMWLCAIGYTDVLPETAYEKGIECEWLQNNFTKSIVKNNLPLSRGDTVRLLYQGLLCITADGKMVKTALIEAGIFDEADFSGMTCGLPLPSASGSVTFADDLNAMMPENENYIFSPYSIHTAFSMLTNGTAGQTEQELKQALHIENDQFNQVAKNLSDTYTKEELLQIETANSLWLNQSNAEGADFLPAFTTLTQSYYGATTEKVNNQNAVQKINDWVSEKTHGKIQSITDNPDFMAALLNAVYFMGKWQTPFPVTSEKPFYSRSGETQTAEFMHTTRYFDYAQQDGITLVELPYRADNLDVSMFVMMADEKIQNPCAVVANSMPKSTRIALSMPKFEVDFSANLVGMMNQLGVKTVFTNQADLSKMLNHPEAQLTGAVHKAYIKVDEQGTEAAAVTGLMVGATSAPMEDPIPVIFDKPFTYVIMDKTNLQPLFVGEISSMQ
ncbi:MAG: S-layer homology domain-containing protein [Clostridia bacterium]|nr:S-layer homology domain-containing protein [Clostridia bacterium]